MAATVQMWELKSLFGDDDVDAVIRRCRLVAMKMGRSVAMARDGDEEVDDVLGEVGIESTLREGALMDLTCLSLPHKRAQRLSA